MVAIRNIKIGEEITYDYSTTEASLDGTTSKLWGKKYNYAWSMRCNCGSKKCRRIIKEFPFLPEEIKLNYYNLNVLPNFVLRKFRRIYKNLKK